MHACVGLSVGATNLVAAGPDGTSTVRSAAVAWGDGVLTGFVDRVGDPIPIVAPDGSAHSPDALLVAALTDLNRTVGRPGEAIGLAVPAHWPAHLVDRVVALMPHTVVTSDAVAALTALRAHPGLPSRGVVVLCDFGATGTSITLADASANFRPIGTTARIDDFSGDMVDRAVLAHLLAGSEVDPAVTSAVQSLNAFRQQCRIAKERLSFQTAVGLAGPQGTTVRLTRPELEGLLREPLNRVLAALDDVMWRNGIHRSDLAAVATVGGGSRIPMVTQSLSEFLRLPVTTTPQAQSVAAIGAAMVAGRDPETVTRVAFVPSTGQPPTAAAVVVAPGEPTAAAASLAWSVGEPAAYVDDPQYARPDIAFVAEAPDESEEPRALRWFQRPAVLFAAAAGAAIVAGAGLVVTADTENTSVASAGPAVVETPVPAASPVNAGPAASAPAAETVVVTQGSVARQPAAPQQRQASGGAPPEQRPASIPQAPASPPATTTTAPPTTTTSSAPTSSAPPTTEATSAPPSSTPPSSPATAPPSTVTPTATPMPPSVPPPTSVPPPASEPPPASAPPSSVTVAPEAPVEVPVLSPEG